jgi:hypothetical protein
MAKAKGNGRDLLLEKMVDVLEGLRADVQATNKRLNDLETSMSSRLDAIIENTGGHYRDHERRIAGIEARVAKLETRSR